MTPNQLQTLAINPALSLLPQRMDSPEARQMLITIAIQESALQHRAQVPSRIARGLWQFERGGGVSGVLEHRATKVHATAACEVLLYAPTSYAVHPALEHNDVLAAVFARLLLWSLPQALPNRDDPEEGWRQYLDSWRPGSPHSHTWPANWRTAQGAVA